MWKATLLSLLALIPLPLPAAEFFTLPGHGGPIKGIAVDPNGRILTASFDNSVGLWDGTTPRWLEHHAAAVNVAIFTGADGAVSAGDDFAVVAWDLTTGAAKELGRHRGKVMSLALSPDGLWVASAGWDGRIGLWPLAEGQPRSLSGHSGSVNDVTFSADGQTLFSGSADGSLRIWDLATGKVLAQLVEGGFGINTLALNAPGGWLAYGTVDGVTRVIDRVSGAEIKDFTLDRRPILAMAQDQAGTMLAIGDGQGYISVLDTRDWSVLADFRAARHGPIWALAFSPDGESILAGGLEDAVYAWPLDGPKHGQMAPADRTFLQTASDDSPGERQFNRKCSICHSLEATGLRRAGPSLKNLFGRRAGTLPGYRYSEVLRQSRIIWDAATIDALFDLGPEVYIKGTKMPMQRITDPGERAALIAFLRRHSTPEE